MELGIIPNPTPGNSFPGVSWESFPIQRLGNSFPKVFLGTIPQPTLLGIDSQETPGKHNSPGNCPDLGGDSHSQGFSGKRFPVIFCGESFPKICLGKGFGKGICWETVPPKTLGKCPPKPLGKCFPFRPLGKCFPLNPRP